MTMHTVIRQDWLESERGWGTRPDGYSLHLTEEDCKEYINAYWAEMPDEAPDEYSRPEGRAYTVEVEKEVFEKVLGSKCGIRFY